MRKFYLTLSLLVIASLAILYAISRVATAEPVQLLTCTVGLGVGTVSVLPGIVQTPRYDGATVQVDLATGNLVVSGPLDKGFDYAEHGYHTSIESFEGKWVITLASPSEDFDREHILILASGSLLWTSVSYATILNAAAASLYVGHCQ